MLDHILIIGAKGMLGRELVGWLESGSRQDGSIACSGDAGSPRRISPKADFPPACIQPVQPGWPHHHPVLSRLSQHCRVSALDLDELDITRRADVLDTLGELRPTLVINAAAYTDVDGCESHEPEAAAVNAAGPVHLAEACARLNARLVHVSTDYVFDGRKQTPYVPADPIDPQSAYGRTKAAGETKVQCTLPDRHAIVRTSWLFGVHGKNFVKTILKLSAEKSELRVVTDQVGRPTYARDLAAALLIVGCTGQTGTFHFCNAGECSWNEFAAEIVRLVGGPCRVLPQSTADLNRPAPRPAYSVLSTESLTRTTGIVPRPWQEALAECIAELTRVAEAA